MDERGKGCKVGGKLRLLLSRLRGVRRISNGWMALCPAHEDHNPSLSVSIGREGRILLHCFAGCSLEEILKALGMRMSDLFPEDPQEDLIDVEGGTETESENDFDLDLRDKVYKTLIGLLRLRRTHERALRKRGLKREEVEILRRRGYRSLPSDIHEISVIGLYLKERYGEELFSVPGFYETQSGSPRFVTWKGGGLFIPVREASGRIVGARIRLDKSEGGKYRHFSASAFGGVKAEIRTHVALPELSHSSPLWRRVWLTEGELKADISCLRLGEPVLGISGVTAWRVKDILKQLRKLGAREVIIAFDADLRRNPQVRGQRNRLALELLRSGLEVKIGIWDEMIGKGLDDLLIAGWYPEVKPHLRGRDGHPFTRHQDAPQL